MTDIDGLLVDAGKESVTTSNKLTDVDRAEIEKCLQDLFPLEIIKRIPPGWEAVYSAGMERAAKICEEQVVNRPDDHVANYFDGGCRHCATQIRAKKP